MDADRIEELSKITAQTNLEMDKLKSSSKELTEKLSQAQAELVKANEQTS